MSSFRDGAIVVLGLFFLVAHLTVPHVVLRRFPRRRRVDAMTVRPRAAYRKQPGHLW